MTKTKKKKLTPHQDLVRTIIFQQAGTVSKAVLEGVMNSEDAESPEIRITATTNKITLVDAGKGFESEEFIDEYFSKLGAPHELDEDGISTDAKHGRFRIGRGQMFAMGVNTWKSGPYKMVIDAQKSMEYDFTDGNKEVSGCQVEIELYSRLDPEQMRILERELQAHVRFMDMSVYFNGTKINKDPAQEKWDKETDFAYVKIDSTTHYGKGIDVYQQGVLVETIPAYTYGVGGTVVTKCPVALNTARNQVLRSCKVWKKITQMLKKDSEKHLASRVNYTLTQPERIAKIEQIMGGGTYHDYDEDGKAQNFKLFEDVSGHMWSAQQLFRQANTGLKTSKYLPGPRGKVLLSFAELGSLTADRLMQRREAIVLTKTCLMEWGLTEENFQETIAKKMRINIISYSFDVVPLGSIKELSEFDTKILPDNQLTPTQRRCQGAIQQMLWHLAGQLDRSWSRNSVKCRDAYIGMSDTADGWTDGRSYVAVNVEFLKKTMFKRSSWYDIALLLIHEICHEEDSNSDTHTHSPDFYRAYHDRSRRLASDLAETGYVSMYKKTLQAANNVPKAFTTQLDLDKDFEYYAKLVESYEQEKMKKNKVA